MANQQSKGFGPSEEINPNDLDILEAYRQLRENQKDVVRSFDGKSFEEIEKLYRHLIEDVYLKSRKIEKPLGAPGLSHIVLPSDDFYIIALALVIMTKRIHRIPILLDYQWSNYTGHNKYPPVVFLDKMEDFLWVHSTFMQPKPIIPILV